MADRYKNFAISTIATPPSPATTGTSLVVATGTGTLFPSRFPYNVTVWPTGVAATAANAEIVMVTNIVADTFTIVRAQEGTSARTHFAGSQIAQTMTALLMTTGGQGTSSDFVNHAFSTALGIESLEDNTTGQANVAVGYQNLKENTIGSGNTAIGTTAMIFNTTGDYNTAIGVDALYTNVGGYSNTALGADALGFNVDGRENCAVGFDSLFKNTYGNHSTCLGFKSLFENLTGSRNVAIGCGAGFWETGSDKFYLDSVDSANFAAHRPNTAADRAGALMYGTFDSSTASNQTLKVNGVLTVGYGLFSGQYAALFGAKSGTNQIAQFSTNDGTLGSTGMKITVTNNTTTSMRIQANEEGTAYTRLDLNAAGGVVQIASTGVATNILGSAVVSQGFGCNAAAAQTAYASGGALNAYGAGANGFDSGANASALHAMVVSIRAALVANGIMS